MSATGFRRGLHGSHYGERRINCRFHYQAHPGKRPPADFRALNPAKTLLHTKNRSGNQTGKQRSINVRRLLLFYSYIPVNRKTQLSFSDFLFVHFITPEIFHPDPVSAGAPRDFRNEKHLFTLRMCHSLPGITRPLNRKTTRSDYRCSNFIANRHFPYSALNNALPAEPSPVT